MIIKATIQVGGFWHQFETSLTLIELEQTLDEFRRIYEGKPEHLTPNHIELTLKEYKPRRTRFSRYTMSGSVYVHSIRLHKIHGRREWDTLNGWRPEPNQKTQ